MNDREKITWNEVARIHDTVMTPLVEKWIDALHKQNRSVTCAQFIAVCRYTGWIKYKKSLRRGLKEAYE